MLKLLFLIPAVLINVCCNSGGSVSNSKSEDSQSTATTSVMNDLNSNEADEKTEASQELRTSEDVGKEEKSIVDGKENKTKPKENFLKDESIKEAPLKKPVEVKENQQNSKFKKLIFGFNLGYLGDLKNGENINTALSTIKNDGFTNVRVYEPFTRNLMNNQPQQQVTYLKSLTNNGFNVLLSLSNYPFTSNGTENQKGKNADKDKQRMLQYTNRYTPDDLSEYGVFLNGFIDQLNQDNTINNLSFEIGNEPDAKQYFWGTPTEFISIARKTKSILLKYKRPIYCCGFTSEFANEGDKMNRNYSSFLYDNDFFRNVNASFHFYQNDKDGFSNVNIPNAKNGAITELNMFSHQNKGTFQKNLRANSPQLGALMIQLLDYAYTNDLKIVYLFKLTDNADKEGTLGFFDSNGLPKASYNYFKKMYSIIKDGYFIEKTNNYIKIIGQTKSVVLSLTDNMSPNGVVFANKVVDKSSNFLDATRKLSKGDWLISNN